MKLYNIRRVLLVCMLAFLGSCVTENDTPNPSGLNLQSAPCNAPTYLLVSPLSGNSVTLQWDSAHADLWEVQYGPTGFVPGSGTSVIFNAASSQITGLDPAVNYQFYIRTRCNSVQSSPWLGPVVPGGQAEFCSRPTDVQVSRNAANTAQALLSWSAGAATAWDIQYGPDGFTLGAGTNTTATTPAKTIVGLGTGGYDFYVRTRCTASQTSDWVGPIQLLAVGAIDPTAIMTANIGGTLYNQMQPYMYPITDAVTVVNADVTLQSGEHRYLQIQGDTTNDLNTSIEFNFYLPDSMWQLGTYPLFDVGNLLTSNFAQISIVSEPLASPPVIKKVVEGSGNLVITEFNLTIRRVKGTFSFSYTKQVEGSPEIQTVQVTAGTFNYPLDADYFN